LSFDGPVPDFLEELLESGLNLDDALKGLDDKRAGVEAPVHQTDGMSAHKLLELGDQKGAERSPVVLLLREKTEGRLLVLLKRVLA
jgi:hypothetical protein